MYFDGARDNLQFCSTTAQEAYKLIWIAWLRSIRMTRVRLERMMLRCGNRPNFKGHDTERRGQIFRIGQLNLHYVVTDSYSSTSGSSSDNAQSHQEIERLRAHVETLQQSQSQMQYDFQRRQQQMTQQF
ncbi:hypothetical protein L1887_00887 [Cichorium endivia]|nr:hypothetical protein L1887_00887 [Cichorium endivia]